MRTVRDVARGKLILRLVETKGGYSGVIIGAKGGRLALIEGTDPDEVWQRLLSEADKTDQSYFSFKGARARFLSLFPEGFAAAEYAKEERTYKFAAKTLLEASAPVTDAADGNGFSGAILKVVQATNLLRYEERTLAPVLQGPSADAFIQAAARFALHAGAQELLELERILRPYDCARWTVVTYLPFLWRTDTHMFLKPEVTKDFAARVGHRFAHDYESRLDIRVYESLLDLTRQTELELASFRPKDRIDVQSFIWVIGKYKHATDAPASKKLAQPAKKSAR